MDNINMEKVNEIIDFIYADPERDFDFIIKHFSDDGDYMDENDESMIASYSNYFKNKLAGHELTDEEAELLSKVAVRYMSRKIAARIEAKRRADADSYIREKKEYYGSQWSAFDHLFERYLGDFGYHIHPKSILFEILEEKQKS